MDAELSFRAEALLQCHEGRIDLNLPPDFLPDPLMKAYRAAEMNDVPAARRALDRLETPAVSTDGLRDGLAHLVWAMTHQRLGDLEAAEAHYEQALDRLDHPALLNEAARFFQATGRLARSIALRRQALRADPHNAVVRANLGSDLIHQGQTGPGLAELESALTLAPGNAVIRSMYLGHLHYDESRTRADLYRAHVRWADAHSTPQPYRDYPQSRDAERRLRIGYVSPDICTHSVAYFFEPLLDGTHGDQVENYVYANVTRPDGVTQRLQQKCAGYRSISGWTDEQALASIREDRIDVLVDLAGHWRGNRLSLFTHRPAPIQVTYLGYPDTTGLDQIDYRLTDPLTECEGAQAYHSERLWPLERGFLCYRAPSTLPAVSALPALARGHVTFGSFNNNCKLSGTTLSLWARILRDNPTSRLVLKFFGGHEPSVVAHYRDCFARRQVPPDRLDILGWNGEMDHLRSYNNIDIALDTFPYAGTTTTCEALCMGVPVVTLAGRSHLSRVGLSILTRLGLEPFVAQNPRDYVGKSLAFAQQLNDLSTIRSSLRGLLFASSLCRPDAFARQVEGAYRAMWRRWCTAEVEKAAIGAAP